MSTALERIAGTPLSIDVRGSSVHVVVAADKYTVARISEHINDREEYARLFSASADLLAAAKQAEAWLSGWASAEPYLSVIRTAIAKAEGGDVG